MQIRGRDPTIDSMAGQSEGQETGWLGELELLRTGAGAPSGREEWVVDAGDGRGPEASESGEKTWEELSAGPQGCECRYLGSPEWCCIYHSISGSLDAVVN